MGENLRDARGKKQQAKGGINWGHTDKAIWDWVLLLSQAKDNIRPTYRSQRASSKKQH